VIEPLFSADHYNAPYYNRRRTAIKCIIREDCTEGEELSLNFDPFYLLGE